MAKKAQEIPVGEVLQKDGGDLLSDIIDTTKARDPEARDRSKQLIENLVSQLLDPGMRVEKGVTRTINARIAHIDEMVSRQLSAVMHRPEFQQLESAWRGLHRFVMASETGDSMKIRVMSASKDELLKDFQAAPEFTESALWRKVYQSEYGQFGGDPYACLIGDYYFDKGPRDVELMEHLSGVAAGAHAPFLAATAPGMFGMESLTQMPDPRDVAKIFDKSNPQNTKWLSFRDSEDSRYVTLTLPRVLSRLPYGKDNPVEDFNFVEDVDGLDHDKYLWHNSAYAMGERLTDAFAKHHWCVAIRGVEGGGLVSGLPIHTFKTREGDIAAKCPTEVLIPDDREKELSDLGFLALLNEKNSDRAAFFGGHTTQRPKKYDTEAATANADLSRKLPYLMCTSRIAHYLKSICRDKIGAFMSRDDCEKFLNRWLSNYVLKEGGGQADKARRPLKEAKVSVTEDKSRPGCYRAVAWLKPHFQLEELNVALRLVADLPEAAK